MNSKKRPILMTGVYSQEPHRDRRTQKVTSQLRLIYSPKEGREGVWGFWRGERTTPEKGRGGSLRKESLPRFADKPTSEKVISGRGSLLSILLAHLAHS